MIGVSVRMFLFVYGHKDEHVERNGQAYELHLQCMSQKWEKVAFIYLKIESDLRRVQKSCLFNFLECSFQCWRPFLKRLLLVSQLQWGSKLRLAYCFLAMFNEEQCNV